MSSFQPRRALLALSLLMLTHVGAQAEPGLGSSSALPPWLADGFYVRADYGYADHDVGGFHQPELEEQGGGFVSEDFKEGHGVQLGAGWRVSPYIRVDFTGEYRWADLEAEDRLVVRTAVPDGVTTIGTKYRADFSSFVGLANGYLDFPAFNGVTPYVGAGIGFARNRISNLKGIAHGTFVEDVTGATFSSSSKIFSKSESAVELAVALMAGLGVDLSDDATLDLGYRYLDLGGSFAASTDLLACDCGSVGSPMNISGLQAHELRIGLRWDLSD